MAHEGMYRGIWSKLDSPPPRFSQRLTRRARWRVLPFMPELAAYCGQGFKVNRRADKICDTVMYVGSRFIPDAVLLDDVRCDRSAHSCCHCRAAL